MTSQSRVFALVVLMLSSLSSHAVELQFYTCKGEHLGAPAGTGKAEVAVVVSEGQLAIADSQGVQLNLPRTQRRSNRRSGSAVYESRDEFTGAYAKAVLPVTVADASRAWKKSFMMVYQLEYVDYLGDLHLATVKAICQLR